MTERAHQSSTETAVARAPVIQRACSCGEAAGISGKCPACGANDRLGVQTKLTISRPGDRHEQEADRIADQVMTSRSAPMTGPLPVTPLVQRQPEEEEEEEVLQAKAAVGQPQGQTQPPAESAAHAVSSGGRPLSMEMRNYFEPRFGTDLSAVRIHDGPRAAGAARAINARAYTLGQNIAFARGEFAPQTTAGRRLIAHELTHTLQQKSDGAQDRIHRDPQGQSASRPVNTPHLNLLQATMEMCRSPDTAAILQRIDTDNVEIRFFREAHDRWKLDDGTEEDEDLSTRLRGNTFIDPSTGHGIVRLNERLSVRDMVTTLYHEMQHWIHRQTPTGPRGLESEIQARIATEQMAIDRGWPETVSGYRTPDGRVNEAFIRQQMQTSPHYSPQGRTRIPGSRRYGGETTVPGPFACPPVGDFPTPRSDIAYA